MEQFSPEIYEGPALQDRSLTAPAVPASPVDSGATVPLSAVLDQTQAFKEGTAALVANSKPKADAVDVASAAASQWLTTGVLKYMMQPSFAKDDTKPSEQLQYSEIVPNTDDEMEYYLGGNSAAERAYRLDRIGESRKAASIMADRPWLAMGVSALDPLNFTVGLMTGGVSTAAGVSSGIAKAAFSGAQMAAITGMAGTQRPMSAFERNFAILAEAAAGPLMGIKGTKKVVQGGKIVEVPRLVAKDSDFPAAELRAIAKDAPVSPIKEVEEVVGEVGDTIEAPVAKTTSGASTLPPELSKAAPRYSYGSKGFGLTFESDIDRALYIVADGVKRSKSDAKYVQWITDVTGMTEEEMRAEGAMLRSDIKSMAKTSKEDTLHIKNESGWNSQINPDTIEGEVMLEDIGLAAEKSPIPEALRPGVVHTPESTTPAVMQIIKREEKTYAQKVGGAIAWNIHRAMKDFGEVGSKIADLLFDNNANLRITSTESHVRAIQSQLKVGLGKFDNMLRDAMAEDGFGMLKQITHSREASDIQAAIEKEVHLEMLRRDQFSRQGRAITHEGIPPRITKMADTLDEVAKRTLEELKAAGVTGAELLEHKTGWASRRWDSLQVQKTINKLMDTGLTEKAAKAKLIEHVAMSMADANPKFDWEIAHDIAGATINRALRKGMFEDSALNIGQGMDNTKVIRDILNAEGVSPQRVQRIMDVVVGKVDEQGKAGFLKHRIEMDYTHSIDLGDHGVINVTDMFDHNVKDIFDRYVDKSAAEAGFAKSGLKSSSDITALRTEGIKALEGDVAKQQEFTKLFDNTIKHMFGEGSGDDLGNFMRGAAAVNRLVSLGSSGFWQLTEYATLMAQYGCGKAIKYMIQETPFFKKALETAATDKQFSMHLKDILQNASGDSMRLQPFVRRFADGMDIPGNATVTARLQHAAQLVPYLNGMKWIHQHQSRVMANLALDTLSRAAQGDAKMVAQLEKYGVTTEHFKTLKDDVLKHGMEVDKWSDGSWHNVRPAFMKMMDEGVLHARLGDTPAFALLNPVGKFLCTYRGFILTAHNKLLAGGLSRDGLSGVGLLMMYQFPLSALMVQAQAGLYGKKVKEGDLPKLAFGQMGVAGLFGDVLALMTGTKQQLGAPGLIPFDKATKAGREGMKFLEGNGNPAKFAHDAFQATPGLAILAPLKSFEALSNPQ